MVSSHSVQSSSPSPFFSSRCALSASAFGSLPSTFNISTLKPSNLLTVPSVSPFPATLTAHPQLTENPTTLSPVVVTLTGSVNHKPFVCHSCRKTPGVGVPSFLKFISPSHHASTSNSPGIRTSAKHTPNPFRFSTFKTHDLKPFRMCTYEKTGEGVPFTPSRGRGAACLRVTRRNARNFNLFIGLPHNLRTPRGGGLRCSLRLQLSTFNLQPLLLTTHYSLLTSIPLKPASEMAHPYLCTCKKGPAAREPRYSPCAAS
jgi:hypothetical protein